MKALIVALCVLSSSAFAVDYGYLKPEDQKYFKNDSMDGNNQRERIDMTVKEINKMYADMASMKAEIQQLRSDVEELKKKK